MITDPATIAERQTAQRSEPPVPLEAGVFRQQLAARICGACELLTRADVARLTGTSAETVRRWMNGHGDPSPAFLASLCRALGVSAQWLLLGEGEKFPTPLRACPDAAREPLQALASFIAYWASHPNPAAVPCGSVHQPQESLCADTGPSPGIRHRAAPMPRLAEDRTPA